jgi:hypothetical protein
MPVQGRLWELSFRVRLRTRCCFFTKCFYFVCSYGCACISKVGTNIRENIGDFLITELIFPSCHLAIDLNAVSLYWTTQSVKNNSYWLAGITLSDCRPRQWWDIVTWNTLAAA